MFHIHYGTVHLPQGIIKQKRELQRSRGKVKMNLHHNLLASQDFDSKLLSLQLYRNTLGHVVLFRETKAISSYKSRDCKKREFQIRSCEVFDLASA